MSALKVVFCTDGIAPHQIGGMQKHSRLLIEALSSFDVNLFVIHPHKGVKVFDETLKIQEFAIEGIDKKKNYLKESKAYSKRVYTVLKKLPDDTIIYNQGFAVWYGLKEFSNRVITNPHGLEPFQAISRNDRITSIPFQYIFKKIFKKSRLTVSLGGQLTTILLKILPSNKITILPNAVAEKGEFVFKPRPEKKENIDLFFLARFATNKGIHILMKAIEELNNEGYKNKLSFKLGGKGPLYEKYKNESLPENVKLLGFVSDEELDIIYQNSDVFVFPTLFEGMPTVVLEAMSNYLPVIVSDTGATCELVDNENGFVIKPDSVESLKKAIKKYYLLSADEKNRMSYNSFNKCMTNFTWNRVAQKHLDVFKALNNGLAIKSDSLN